MAEVDPDQEAALRRLRAAFGFVQVLRIVDHETDPDGDDNEPVEDSTVDPQAGASTTAPRFRSRSVAARARSGGRGPEGDGGSHPHSRRTEGGQRA